MDKIRRNQNSVKNWLALIIIIAGFCLAYPSTAEAAVQVDAVSSNSTTGISITIPHTTSGTNRLMLVGVSFNNDNLETVTGVTYNSVALTLVGTAANVDDSRVEIWKLVAPDFGTHNVVVTFSADLLQEGFAGVVTFTGVHQTTPLGTFASAAADGITATVDVSSATGELVFDVLAAEYSTSATVGAGQTQRWNILLSGSIGAGSTEPGAATVTMSWTLTAAGDHWAIGGVSVKPAAALALSNWGYRKKIVIDSTKVSANLTNFPVLINLSSDSDLASYAQNDGDDILFTSSTVMWDTGTNLDRLDHEIEKFDGATGQLVAWVKIPSLSSSTDTEIYMYYGNSTCASQQSVTGVWDSSYKAVWHLNENPAGAAPQFKDSTSDAYHATNAGGLVLSDQISGKINGALEFDQAADDYVTVPQSLSITGNAVTAEAWAYSANYATAGDGNVAINTGGGVNTERLWVGPSGGALCGRVTTDVAHYRFDLGAVSSGVWSHVVVRYDGSTLKGYVNGVEVASISASGNILATTVAGHIGARFDTRRANARFDEIRVSDVARSPDWIKTCYYNQNDPSGFYNIGSEEDYEGFGIFSYRAQLTIDSDRVCGTTGSFTDFPVLVLIQNNNDLKTTMNGGKVYNASGYDIVFRASDGKTQVYHEVEKYDGTAGTLIAWVKIPTLSKGTDTKFYMYYGNSGITSATHEPDKVWDSNYVGVWHLKETTGTHNDSSSYGNNGAPGGGVIQDAVGKINGADDFDGNDDYIEIGTTGFTPTNMTLTAWVKADALADRRYIFGHTTQTAYDNRIQIYTAGTAPTLLGLGLGDTHSKDTGSALSTGTWYHVALVKDATNYWVYLDNAPDMSGTYTGLSTLQTYADIGNDGNSLERTESWNGVIDEVHISKIVRDAEWICAEYNNQKWPNKTDSGTNGFITVGSAEDIECSYSYYKQITIPLTQVSGTSDLPNFPALISLTGNWLKTTTVDPINGRIENSNGYDIIFRDSFGTLLDHEIEQYDGTNGTLVAWVRIPILKYNENTIINMYYGNSCISSSQENVTGVWNSNYVGVWHLKEDALGTGTLNLYQDSTANANHGDDYVSATGQGGKIDGGQAFDGVDDYVNCGNNTSLDVNYITIEFWLNVNTWISDGGILSKGTSSTRRYWIWTYGGAVSFEIDEGTHQNSAWIPTAGQWAHLALIYNGTNVITYRNGAQENSYLQSTGTIDATTEPLLFGDIPPYNHADVNLDEVRISNVVRSIDWIKTSYNNQNSPSAFYIIGDEEAYAPTAVDLISFTATGQDVSVVVEWETAQEINNLGFNLYRSSERYGSYTKLNRRLMPGLISSVSGRQYTSIDTDVTRGILYYYMLEDVDLSGIRTMHGPVCVDWDGDGIPDDYNEEGDEGSDDDTGDDPEVEIPLLELYEVDLGSKGWSPSRNSSATWVKLTVFRARQEEEGVALEWETGYEVDNLGYHIYREVDGKYYRITTDLVPGSVFKVGAGRELPAGQSYVYFDGLSRCTGKELYWLDCVELNGGRASFGPIRPEVYGQPIAERLRARFRSIEKHQISRAEAIRKVRTLRVELSTGPTQEQKSQAVFYQFVPGNPSEPRLPPGEEQWALSAKPAVKISIKEDGWYRVGEAELVAAGLDSGVDPRFLQLYADGEEQSMKVTGSDDGRFDPEDGIEFYGTELDTPFTDARAYWLVVGSRPGRRLDTPFTDIRLGPDKRMRIPRGLRGRGSPLSFPYTVELKERTFYFAALKNGEGESFFGSVISTDPVNQLLTVTHADPSPPEDALLEIVVQGATDFSHQIKIQLNYREVGEVVFSGQERGAVRIQVPQGYLLEGDNIVTLAAQGGDLDVSLVDYIRLTYWRTYTSDEDVLKFTAMGGEWVSIGGFSSPEIRVVDITDSIRMFNVRGKVKSDGSGYAVTFKVPRGGERTLFAFSEENVKQPAGIATNLASSWHEINQGAEVVVIAHGELLESVRSLKELREQQGWSVELVDVEDLYDEFNFGARSPWALKDFLTLAYEYWNPQPRYLILVGDTSYDPRNYLGFGEFDLVPTKFVDTEYLKTASDDWFVDFDDDGLPEMAVGRLPVGSAEEAATVVSKIISYEGASGLMNEALLVADVNDGFDYEGASAEVRSLFPGEITVREILRGQSATARSDLLTSLNQGQLLVNYIGHGSTRIWKGNLFSSSDAWSLTNSPYLSFFVSMTCLNGFFQDPSSESMAEALLKAERGGAVAVWTSSGLTYPGGQLPMNKELIQLLFYGQGLTIGEVIMGAKQAVTNRDIRRTWILFGDPTLRLR